MISERPIKEASSYKTLSQDYTAIRDPQLHRTKADHVLYVLIALEIAQRELQSLDVSVCGVHHARDSRGHDG